MSKDIRVLSANYYNVRNPEFAGGAPTDGTSDATPAIRAAYDAALAAGGGIVYIPLGKYKISGPLLQNVDNDNCNCQIPIRLVTSNSNMPKITILGESSWDNSTEIGTNTERLQKGVILESTIIGTGSRPAVFGCPSYGAPNGQFNMGKLHMENIIVRTRTMTGSTHIAPSMSAIYCRELAGLSLKWVKADIQSPAVVSVSPAGTGTVGIYYPKSNNNSVCEGDWIVAEGYESGVYINEHANLFKVSTLACVNGIHVGQGVNHGMTIHQLQVEGNQRQVYFEGNGNLLITSFHTEHYPNPVWYQFQTDVYFEQEMGNCYITHFNQVESYSPGGGHDFVTNKPHRARVEYNGDRKVDDYTQTIADAATINMSLYGGKAARFTLGGNRTLAIQNQQAGRIRLYVKQDSTGNRLLSLPGNFKTPAGFALSTAAGAEDLLEAEYDGANWYLRKVATY